MKLYSERRYPKFEGGDRFESYMPGKQCRHWAMCQTCAARAEKSLVRRCSIKARNCCEFSKEEFDYDMFQFESSQPSQAERSPPAMSTPNFFAKLPCVRSSLLMALSDVILAATLNNQAERYKEEGRYADAEPLYKQVLAIHENVHGPNHADVALALTDLAELYKEAGRYDDAEPLYKRALGTWQKALGPNHPDVAQALNNLAGLYTAQGRYADAEPPYKRALAIFETALGPDYPSVASALNNLADLYSAQGRHSDAEPLYKRALAIREKALGPDHPDVAQSLNKLADLYSAQGRHADAEPLYKRALGSTADQKGSIRRP